MTENHILKCQNGGHSTDTDSCKLISKCLCLALKHLFQIKKNHIKFKK